MAAVCQVTGAVPGFGHNISHSHRRTKRRFDPNVQKKTYFVPSLRRNITINVSAKGIKVIDARGIEAVILQNDCRSRLARVILATGDRPYLSTLQSVTRLQRDGVDKILVPSRIWAPCHHLRLTMGFSLKRRCARVRYPNLHRP